jgi:uncharacterized OB-fold protein
MDGKGEGKKCAKCGREIADFSQYCPNCGNKN